jgi:hypothetical protein
LKVHALKSMTSMDVIRAFLDLANESGSFKGEGSQASFTAGRVLQVGAGR